MYPQRANDDGLNLIICDTQLHDDITISVPLCSYITNKME